jgi:hypothetical protein
MIRWSLDAMADGKYQSHHPFSEQFGDADSTRRAFAGRRFGWRAALILIKADLSEFANTFGVPTWSSKLNPCFLCHATKQQLYDVCGLSPTETTFPAKTFDTYLADCARCEVQVTLTDPMVRAELKANLFLDARQHGSHGRALLRDVAHLGLLKGDRLEPSQAVPDTHGFDVLPLPLTLTFWRVSSSRMTHHRNPLFGSSVHVSLHDSVAIDWLHTLSLGIFQDFLGELIIALIRLNAWQVPGAADVRKNIRLQDSGWSFGFYASQSRLGISYTQVQRLDDTMFGTDLDPKCKLHGAETNGFLEYGCTLIAKSENLLPTSEVWHRTGQALLRLRVLCDKDPATFVAADTQEPSLNTQTDPHRHRHIHTQTQYTNTSTDADNHTQTQTHT